jgi:flagellar hook-length control protein FliK
MGTMSATTIPPELPHQAPGLAKFRAGVAPMQVFAPGAAAANDPDIEIPDFATLLRSALEPEAASGPIPASTEDPATPQPAPQEVTAPIVPNPLAGVVPSAVEQPAASQPGPERFAESVAVTPRPARDEARPAAGEAAVGRAPVERAAIPPSNPVGAERPVLAEPAAPAAPAAPAVPAHATPPAAPAHLHAAELHVGPRAGVPGFAESFAARVTVAMRSGTESASITLNPAELGPVGMQIEVRGSEAHVAFAAAHPLTREAIAEALPRLREMLAAHGLDLAGSSVGAELPRRDAPAGSAGSGGENRSQGEATADAEPEPRGAAPRLVDTFA